MPKFFMSSDGVLIGDADEDHADIARRVLPTHNVTATDYGDLYTQMFRLGYARIIEDAREFQIERKAGLSEAQKKAVEAAITSGKNVLINNQQFVESKTIRG